MNWLYYTMSTIRITLFISFYIILMELKFTGTIEVIEPIQRSGKDNDYPRLPIKVKWVGVYNKNRWMFMIHGDTIEEYKLNEWDVVDIYYRMNTGRYADSGKLHWSNNVIRIVQVDPSFDPYEHF